MKLNRIPMNWLLEEMDSYKADGVDFVPIFGSSTVYASYTRGEVLDGLDAHTLAIPKSARRYWTGTKENKHFCDPTSGGGVYEIENVNLLRHECLVHVDISISSGHVHAALYSQDGKFGALNTKTMSDMIDELCDRWEPWITYVIDPRNIGMALIDGLVRRQVKVIPPKSLCISEWLPKAERR